MSALKGKGDPSTSAVSENIIPPEKSPLTKSSEDAENTTESLILGDGDAKKNKNDGNLISVDLDTVEKGNIIDTNPKSDTLVEGDQIFDKTAAIATELSETTSLEVPCTSEAKTLLSQNNVLKDTTSNKELEKTKEITTEESINLAGNKFDDQNDSFDEDLELKWEDDDEKDEEYSTNLSDEALKLLDQELGIEDKVAEIETNTNIEIADDITKQNIITDITEEKEHKVLVQDTKSEINKDIPVETEGVAKSVLENIDTVGKITEIGNDTKTLTKIDLSTDEETNIIEKNMKLMVSNENKDEESSAISKSELVHPHVGSKVLNEEMSVSTLIPEKRKEINEQNQSHLKTDMELTSNSNKNVKDVQELENSQKEQITEDSIKMDTVTPNIASEITANIEETDVKCSEYVEKIETIDNAKEITEQPNILEQDNKNKIDITIAIKEMNDVPLKEKYTNEKPCLKDCTDIEMTDINDKSVQENNSSEQIKVNCLGTKNPERDLSKKGIPSDEECEAVTVKHTETKVTTMKINKKEVPPVTKGMKTDLGLNKPDVMLEIPTQELIDIDDFDDSFEMDKEIIDSEVNDTLDNENDTLPPKTKTLLKENTITDDKITKLTIEQREPTTQSKEKGVTVTELVKIATEKEQSVETIEKSDRSNIILDADTLKVGEKGDNPILREDSVTKSISEVNDDKISGEISSKISDDNLTVEPTVQIDDNIVIKEPNSRTTDSNVTVEPMSKINDDNTTVPTTEVNDDRMTVEPTSKSIDDSTAEVQTSKVNESQNLNENMKTEVSKEDLNVAKSSSKVDHEETTKLDKNMTDEPISKPNDGKANDNNKIKELPATENMTPEISKSTQNTTKEASKGTPEMSKLDENMPAESISKVNNDNMTKESSADDNMTAELSKDNPKTTETITKIDDDMADDPEISDSLGLLAESSRVMEDDEQDEDDDSDDFDQDDESSNLQTAEHSEESNPPSDEAQPDDKEAMPEDSVVEEDGIVFNEDTTTGIEIVDDIVCEETDIVEKVGAIIESDIKSTKDDEIPQEELQSKEDEVTSDDSKKEDGTVLKELLLKDKQGDETQRSPSKSIKLSISKTNDVNVMTYVDLDGSSDDEIQEIKKEKLKETKEESVDEAEDDTVEEIKPKHAFKMTKLNTSEVTIKTGVSSKPPLIIPEITNVSEIDKVKDNDVVETKQSLEEIFNIDSDTDDEDSKKPIEQIVQTKFNPKCINPMCITRSTEQHYVSDAAAMRHYGATKRRAICAPCLANVDTRNEALIKGMKDLTPLLELNMEKPTNQLVEISDSESDDDSDILKECNELIGLDGAKMLNEKLADLINDAWEKFNMDDRLKDSENYINGELQRLDDEGTEINKLLNECQEETDRIRNELYKTFERSSKCLPPVVIHDTPVANFTCLEKDEVMKEEYFSPFLRNALEEPPAKRPNLGVTSADTETQPNPELTKPSDDVDVSVVLLSAESAPDDLPPPGEVTRPPLRVGMQVHAMRNAFGSWLRGRILDIQPKQPGQQYTHCRVKFDHNIKNPCKVLPARCIAFQEPCSVRMTIGTRVLALFKDSNGKESFYSGVVAEIPNPVNTYRYLVFFDDGYAQYVKHKDTRLVCEAKSMVWEEVHPFIREFVKDYLLKYPERPMVRLHAGQRLNTEWNGKWWTSRVLQVDASLAHVHFEEDNRTEWIYRGSTRLAPLYLELQAAGRSRTRLPRSKAQFRTNMPYVEYMRSEEQTKQQQQLQQEEMIRRQRSVAKKSVSLPQPTPMVDKPDNVTSRVVYYTPKNAVKPYKMVSHSCGPQCRRTDVLSLKELRTYNPLAKPLLSGWERMQVRFKGSKHIMYRAPCGRRIRDMKELHRYLRAIQSDLPVDLFDFNVNTHCLAEFVLHKYNVMKKDLSHGKESVPIPCVNYYDDSLPEFCSYNTERTPTAGVPLNLDPDFLCGCDCEDDCADKTKCACWKMTLEGARTIGLDSPNVGYVYRRLPEPLPSGIYECNSRCKCKSTCLNRVAQHPLQLKLQVFKTLKRGWGIRALNDVPKGSFLCVYAGNLLTDATANLDGLNEGDEYLAELDYIEVVEQMKEGFEEDIPEADKKLDKKESKQSSSKEDEETESEEDTRDSDKNDKDGDFRPGYIGLGLTEFNKRLRKRGKKKPTEGGGKEKPTNERKTNDCITISDDEEVREPSRFTAQAGMGDKGFISKYRSVRTLFGKDEACYIMDAKVQGNIGRYLNHSCCPNVFVQNVFVDTHDPRFPWVAFFALSHIRAGTELTWNYNYDIGSVPGKILYCYCGAHNCRGRLL